jgi:hypothetical protein
MQLVPLQRPRLVQRGGTLHSGRLRRGRVGPFDAGLAYPRCATSDDCTAFGGPGQTCIFNAGCPGVGLCVGAQCDFAVTADSPELCGCDGASFRSAACATRPYAHPGPCP